MEGREGKKRKKKEKKERKKYSRVRRRVAQIIFHRVATVPDRGSGIHAPMDMQRRQNIMQRSLLSSLLSSISPYPTKEGFVAKRSFRRRQNLTRAPSPFPASPSPPVSATPPPSPVYSYSLCKAFSPLRGPAVYAFASSIDVMLFLLPSIFMLIHKHSFRIAVESSTVFSHTFEEKYFVTRPPSSILRGSRSRIVLT